MISRTVEDSIHAYLKRDDKRVLFIWGPRRSGKTTILKEIGAKLESPIFNFTLLSDQELFVPRREVLEKLARTHPVILIDEIQYFPEATLSLKALFDEFDIKIIATGSSELRQKSKDFDSLTDRYTEIYCLPLSLEEALNHLKTTSYRIPELTKQLVENAQIFGSYPEITTMGDFSTEVEMGDKLEKIVDTYVLKDIMELYNLKNSRLAKDILLKVALQLGGEVSLRELASSLQANVSTVANYIEIFVKNYVLIELPSFKTNVRKAVSENRKLYFWDLGIRNALVKDFRRTKLRPDKGGVFENLCVAEIFKVIKNYRLKLNPYFYREYGGREVDVVLEDYKKRYMVFEIKEKDANVKPIFPLPNEFKVITPWNLTEVLKTISKIK